MRKRPPERRSAGREAYPDGFRCSLSLSLRMGSRRSEGACCEYKPRSNLPCVCIGAYFLGALGSEVQRLGGRGLRVRNQVSRATVALRASRRRLTSRRPRREPALKAHRAFPEARSHR